MGVALAGMLVALILTVTRASWAGLLASAFTIALVGASRRTLLWTAALALPLALAGLFVLQQKRQVGFIDTQEGSTSWRLMVWREGAQHPRQQAAPPARRHGDGLAQAALARVGHVRPGAAAVGTPPLDALADSLRAGRAGAFGVGGVALRLRADAVASGARRAVGGRLGRARAGARALWAGSSASSPRGSCTTTSATPRWSWSSTSSWASRSRPNV